MFEWKNKTDEYVAKFVTEQFSRAEKRKSIYDDRDEVVVKVFRPRRFDILDKYNNRKGERYGTTLFDQHPANALSKFVGGLIGYMMSRSLPWMQFVAVQAKLMQLDHIKEYCQAATEQILYAAGRSNLYSAIVPHALDAHSVGTSVMIPNNDEVKDRVMFDVVHPKDSFIACNQFGDPIIYLRRLFLTRLTALELFGQDNLPKTWFKPKSSELKEMLTEQEFIWSVFPNNDRGNSLLPEDRMFAVFCVMKGRKSTLVHRSGRDTFPICWRALRESGADYGTSLAVDCLTSALVSNKLTEKSVAAAHLLVEPPTVGSMSLRASFMKSGLNPGSRMWVNDLQREGIKPVMDRLNWPVSDAQLARIHEQIDDKFFIRFFEMLSSGDIKARTAYEVSQMMAEKATLMSGIIDTQEQESHEPSIEALIFYEDEAGRMPDIPDELVEAGGRISIRYLGPLAQLQRTLLQSKGIVDGMMIIAQMAAIDESVAWKFNWREAAEDAAVAQGWPQKYIYSDEVVEETKQRIEQQRAIAEAAETGGKIAKGVGELSKRVEPESPLAKMMAGGGRI